MKAVAYILALPFVALGWLAGTTAKMARLAWAAVREGFDMGAKNRG